MAMTLIEQLRLRQQQGNMQPTDPVGVGAQMNIRNAQSDSVTGAGVAPRTNERFANPIQQAIMGEQQGEPLDPNQPIPLFPDREGLRPPPAEPKPTFRETGILGVGGRMFRSIGESLAATQQADIDRMNTIGESQSQMATNVLYGPQSERAQEQRRMTEARRQPAPVQPAMATTQPAPMPISEAAAAEAQTVAGEPTEQPQFDATFRGADDKFYGIPRDGSFADRVEISEEEIAAEELLNRAAMGQLEGATGTQRRFGTEGGFADVPVFGGGAMTTEQTRRAVEQTGGLMTDPQGRPIPAGFSSRAEAFPDFERAAAAREQRAGEAWDAATEARRGGRGQQGGRELTERDFVNAARDTMGTTKGAEIQGKQQFLQHKADQERAAEGRVSRETNQQIMETNLKIAQNRLREMEADPSVINEIGGILQDKDKMIERMGAFMVSKGFDVLPLAQQQELAQTLVDHIQGIPGSGQSSEARVEKGGLTPEQKRGIENVMRANPGVSREQIIAELNAAGKL